MTLLRADNERTERQLGTADMVWILGGTFRMGSNDHCPEEAPAYRVTVDGFWIDRTPPTNRQFKAFVKATGRVTMAQIPPDPKDHPGALPDMLYFRLASVLAAASHQRAMGLESVAAPR